MTDLRVQSPPVNPAPDTGTRGPVPARRADPDRRHGGSHGADRGCDPVRVPPRQGARGALAATYAIPTARLHRSRRAGIYLTAAVGLAAAGLARHLIVIWDYRAARPLLAAWTLAFAFAAVQWLLSWLDRPHAVTPTEQARLNRMRVVVNVPVWNEDPALVDRCLWSLVNQSRPPQRVDVIDDGSGEVDYTALMYHWWRTWPNGVQVRWVSCPANRGKKHGQSLTFTTDPRADIFVTVDSDTTLAADAIEEGLKPFADRSVQSVAGVELAFNSGVNWLTRTVSARSLFFQIVACGTQSLFGQVLVNRGAFALWRAPMIRRHIAAYVGETFFGYPVTLGDDAALTLFASCAGRAVQQPSAFAFTMYPENLSHHFRQWIRWMRGSTIRNCWRIRYLPLWSFGWWFTVIGYQVFLVSTVLPVLIVVTWPGSGMFTLTGLSAMLWWAYLAALRTTAVRRSDESWWYRAGTVCCYPVAMMWSALVLRPLRFWGIATCLKQGWTTRSEGAELQITEEP